VAQLTLEQHFEKMRRQAQELKRNNIPLEIAARTTHALITNRIFHEGKNSADSRIGNYNTSTELWVSDENLRRAGNHRGKTGKPTKTSYYKSYKALKQQQGFNANVVNLRMKNELQSDFANAKIAEGNDSPPKPNTIKVNPNLFIISLRKQINVDKKEGLEKKYGKIFSHTKAERKEFHRVAKKELILWLSR
jgi:hypothetical protein